MLHPRGLAPTALVALTLVLAACGGATGSATRGGSVAPVVSASSTPAEADGSGPSVAAEPEIEPTPENEPTTDLGPVDVLKGRKLEARRIANQMPLLTAVDDRQTLQGNHTQIIVDEFPTIFDRTQVTALQNVGGFEAGFMASRKSPDSDAALSVGVFEFATAEQATAAAGLLPFGDGDTPLTSRVEGQVVGGSNTEVDGFVKIAAATGQLLFYAEVNHLATFDGQTLAEKGITTVQDGMKDFEVSSNEQRLNLPDDRDGLVTHTLAFEDASEPVWYNANGSLHYAWNQERTAAVYRSAGVDLVTLGLVDVYRAADPAGAALILADGVSRVSTGGGDDIEIEGMPAGTTCTNNDGLVNCGGTVGRYVYILTTDSEEQAVDIARRQDNLLRQL